MKNNRHDQDLPMEDLFCNVLSNRREAVTEKDFDGFMTQLEDSGFFNEKRRKPFIWWWGVFVLAALTGVGLYFHYYWNERPITNTTFVSTPSIQNSISAPVDVETRNTAKNSFTDHQKSDGKKQQYNVKNSKLHVAEVQSDNYKHVPASFEPVDAGKKEEKVMVANDTLSDVGNIVKEKKRDSVRVKYQFVIDTVKTIDSLSIRKRKWRKMQEKNN